MYRIAGIVCAILIVLSVALTEKDRRVSEQSWQSIEREVLRVAEIERDSILVKHLDLLYDECRSVAPRG